MAKKKKILSNKQLLDKIAITEAKLIRRVLRELKDMHLTTSEIKNLADIIQGIKRTLSEEKNTDSTIEALNRLMNKYKGKGLPSKPNTIDVKPIPSKTTAEKE